MASDPVTVTSAASGHTPKKGLFEHSIEDDDFRQFVEMHRKQTVRLRSVDRLTDSEQLPVTNQSASTSSSTTYDSIDDPKDLPKLKPVSQIPAAPTVEVVNKTQTNVQNALQTESIRSALENTSFSLQNVLLFSVVLLSFLLVGRYVPVLTFLFGFGCGLVFTVTFAYFVWMRLPRTKTHTRPRVIQLPDVRTLPPLTIPRFLSSQGATAKFSVSFKTVLKLLPGTSLIVKDSFVLVLDERVCVATGHIRS